MSHAGTCTQRGFRLPRRPFTISGRERMREESMSTSPHALLLTKTRVGRRNHYTVHGELPLRHPMHNGRQVGELLRVLEPELPPRA